MSIRPKPANDDAGGDRAERRKAESRQRLLTAARWLFIERGYDATRPQDIARAADVGYGTFYLHFADKRDCFLAFVEEARAELQIFIRSRLDRVDGVEAQIRALLTALLDYAGRRPGVLKTAMTDLSVIAPEEGPTESLVERWAAGLASDLRTAAGSGTIHADYDTGIVGHAIVGLIHHAVRYGSKHAKRTALIDNVTRFLVRALVPESSQRDPHRRLFMSGEPEP